MRSAPESRVGPAMVVSLGPRSRREAFAAKAAVLPAALSAAAVAFLAVAWPDLPASDWVSGRLQSRRTQGPADQD